MSVEVKTPSPSFGHQSSIAQSSSVNQQDKPSKKDDFVHPSRNIKKRRASDAASKFGPVAQKRRSNSYSYCNKGKGRIVLPTKFLLGGNINDPLNLNSLNDAKINAAQNLATPKSSPLPTPSHRQKVRVLIPPNIHDPLNLNSGEDLETALSRNNNMKRRKKHKKRKSAGDASAAVTGEDAPKTDSATTPLKLVIPDDNLNNKMQNLIDKIVSPVIPQTSPKWKRKRTASESTGPDQSTSKSSLTPQLPTGDNKTCKASPSKPRPKKQHSHPHTGPRYRQKDAQFIHGNYDRYYGKRNPDCDEQDCRLKCFHQDWFEGRDVLDIGCNIGHVTLCVARDFVPRKIVGMDIDSKLVSIARKNVRHYVSSEQMKRDNKRFPISMALTYGPLAAPPFSGSSENPGFPNNVSFVQANYVLSSDELVELQREEYDCIMALSITKWIHLNNGDAGIKRFFKRVYRHLRPGGKFIVEPQSWPSYKKKKGLTAKIYENYNSIKFRPEHFTAYLLSPDVGFSTCDHIDMPYNKSKGFQRPIQVYTKPDTSYTTPREMIESRGVTPLMEIHCTPHFDLFPTPTTRQYTPGSGSTPSYIMWSANATPRMDSRPNTPHHWSSSSRPNTPHTYSPASHQPQQAAPQHKYTSFISGDPRGSTGVYSPQGDSGGGVESPAQGGNEGRVESPVDSGTSSNSGGIGIGVESPSQGGHEERVEVESPVGGSSSSNSAPGVENMTQKGEESPEQEQDSSQSQKDREEAAQESSKNLSSQSQGTSSSQYSSSFSQSQRESQDICSSPVDSSLLMNSPTAKESPRETPVSSQGSNSQIKIDSSPFYGNSPLAESPRETPVSSQETNSQQRSDNPLLEPENSSKSESQMDTSSSSQGSGTADTEQKSTSGSNTVVEDSTSGLPVTREDTVSENMQSSELEEGTIENRTQRSEQDS